MWHLALVAVKHSHRRQRCLLCAGLNPQQPLTCHCQVKLSLEPSRVPELFLAAVHSCPRTASHVPQPCAKPCVRGVIPSSVSWLTLFLWEEGDDWRGTAGISYHCLITSKQRWSTRQVCFCACTRTAQIEAATKSELRARMFAASLCVMFNLREHTASAPPDFIQSQTCLG